MKRAEEFKAEQKCFSIKVEETLVTFLQKLNITKEKERGKIFQKKIIFCMNGGNHFLEAFFFFFLPVKVGKYVAT